MKNALAIIAVLFVSSFMALQACASERAPLTEKDQAYFVSVREAVLKNDKNWLARQIEFPMECFVGGKLVDIESEAQFIKEYNDIIDENVRVAINAQDPSKMFKNHKGFRVGRGSVWMSEMRNPDDTTRYAIIKINNQKIPPAKK